MLERISSPQRFSSREATSEARYNPSQMQRVMAIRYTVSSSLGIP